VDNGAIEVGCHPPVTSLGPGGILITLVGIGLAATPVVATETIAGLPATRTVGPDDGSCIPNAGLQVIAKLQLPLNGHAQLEIIARVARPVSDQTRQQLDAMLTTATYHSG
jgi:hypothetical protein